MGLFDRFRMKIKQADEDYGITAEDGSAEAEQALQNRLSLEEDIRKTREQEDHGKEGNSKTVPKSEWDEDAPWIYGEKDETYGEVVSLGPNTAPIIHENLVELIEASKN